MGGGHIYVADTSNNRIVDMTISGGTCTTFTHTYSAGLNGPQGVALAGDGTVWVADSGNNAVVHLDALLSNLNDGISGSGVFNDPHSLAVFDGGATHTLYVADTYNNRIQVYNIAGA